MTTTPVTGRHRAAQLTLDRVEGGGDRATLLGAGCWGRAQELLHAWALAAPDDGSYHKVDFEVTFSDGATYSGCYDLTRGSDGDLAGHVRGQVEWHTDPDNAALLEPALHGQWAAFAAGYHVGD